MIEWNRESFMAGRPNLDEDRWLLLLVAWFPLFFVIVTLCVKVSSPWLYSYSIKEDGLIEWCTALGFLAAGPVAFLLAALLLRDRHIVLGLLYAGLGAGMLFAMGEEISWGQRVLNLEVPEYFVEHSTKAEINLHNLKHFPVALAFVAVGFYGAFARMLLPGSLRRRFPLVVELLTPRYAISTYFLVTFLLWGYFEYIYYTVVRPLGITIRRDYTWENHFIIGKDQEPVELLLAIGFLVFVLDNWQRYKSFRASAKPVGQAPAAP